MKRYSYLCRRLFSRVKTANRLVQKPKSGPLLPSLVENEHRARPLSYSPSVLSSSRVFLSHINDSGQPTTIDNRRCRFFRPIYAKSLSSKASPLDSPTLGGHHISNEESLLQRITRKLKEDPVEDVASFFYDHCKIHEVSMDALNPNFELTAVLESIQDDPQTSEKFLKTIQGLCNRNTVAATERKSGIGNEDANRPQTNAGLLPGRDHYNLVLNSWRMFQPPSAKRLQRLQEYMESRAGINYDSESCNLILETWAEKGNAERAQAFFDNVMVRKKIPVDVVSFSHVLNAWSKSKSAVATKRADTLLDRMEAFPNLKPSAECYLHVIECWAKSRRLRSEVRIEALVRSMKQRFFESKKLVSCDGTRSVDGKILQTAVLNLLQAYHHIENAHRAEALLFEFVDDFQTKRNLNYPPPTIEMCISVLSTWSKSASSNKANRSEKLLRLMEENPSLPRPDTASYTAVLNCIASSKKLGSAKRAEALLRRMDRKENIESNMVSLTCVLIAWARSEDSNAALKAEQIFEEILDRGMEPDRFVFAGLITAWGRSKREESMVKVEEYFHLIKGLDNSKPTVVEYTAVIQAYANFVSRNIDKSRESVERAEELLDEMLASEDKNLRPNILTYAAVLKTIAAARRIPDRGKHADAVLQKMYAERVEVGPFILNLVSRSRNHTHSSKQAAQKISSSD
ncbi:unnamed protein product [Pseudo-nitzschia multistriata]|uniref:Pentacotripeptide-repeat region of PRORP domain-containing protein n=1 Tax=Pseudo-nitzschia multistriata TaxID=183589 RepID=A0A448YVT6_9STRA|nr:unnamed protein product [Pseudo-nitzschia multistriata]